MKALRDAVVALVAAGAAGLGVHLTGIHSRDTVALVAAILVLVGKAINPKDSEYGVGADKPPAD